MEFTFGPEEYFEVFSTREAEEIPKFLAQFGRDLKDWTHTSVTLGAAYPRVYHYVTARFGSEYGDIEDGSYVPFQ